MNVNFNVGILGHVDSGKTTLAKVLSNVGSTAAFDKSEQSQRRGITLDLGFSSLILTEEDIPKHLKTISNTSSNKSIKKLQFTFVDCPGHASLIRTIIGGASIIDLMILVIDAQKGIQTQTAECLVLGELTCKKLIVAINKIDCLDEQNRDKKLEKMKMKLVKVLENSAYSTPFDIIAISALHGLNLVELVEGLKRRVYVPERNFNQPFLFYVDHCFAIKGQGTVCTGTVIQGKICVNDLVEIPQINEMKKIKSIQIYHAPVETAQQGDRIGICLTQFSAKLLERGILCEKGYVRPVFAAIIPFNKVKYFNSVIKSKSKFHITIGHENVMAMLTIFCLKQKTDSSNFFDQEYEYIDEINDSNVTNTFLLLEFETPILSTDTSLIIGSKLDMNINTNACRIAFWGNPLWIINSKNYLTFLSENFNIFKMKCKFGKVHRVVNSQELIVESLFKKQSNREHYLGKKVSLSTGEIGEIHSTFGQQVKVKVVFPNNFDEKTLLLLKTKINQITVELKYKKYIFKKHSTLQQ